MKLFAEIREHVGGGYHLVIGDARILRNMDTPKGNLFCTSTPVFDDVENVFRYTRKCMLNNQHWVQNKWLAADVRHYRELSENYRDELLKKEVEIAMLEKQLHELQHPRKKDVEVLDRHDIDREITDDMGTMSH